MRSQREGWPGRSDRERTLGHHRFVAVESMDFETRSMLVPAEHIEKVRQIMGRGLTPCVRIDRPQYGLSRSGHDYEADRDEMERYAKDGYLAKQEFLARTDQRQAEVARTNRRRGMGMKD